MKHSLAISVVAALLLAHGAPAHADETRENSDLDGAYFTDGHALVVYGSVIGVAGLALFLDVSAEPRLFDGNEGGAVHNGESVPSWTVSALAGAAGALVIAAPTDARWYHIKGMAEAVGTTLLATEFCKRFFGRHRPDYVAGDPITGEVYYRRSFFSGHSSLTLASTTYLGLYLRQHLFPTWKPDKGALPWWEAATYAGLLGVSVYVPLSRVPPPQRCAHRLDGGHVDVRAVLCLARAPLPPRPRATRQPRSAGQPAPSSSRPDPRAHGRAGRRRPHRSVLTGSVVIRSVAIRTRN
jgi:membrane-associated phospholipid phosphatase